MARTPNIDTDKLKAQGLQLRRKAGQIAKEDEADPVFIHIRQGFLQIIAQQAHDGADLLFRSLPVLRREA